MGILAVEDTNGANSEWDWKASYVERLKNGDGMEVFSEASVTPDTTLILAGPPRVPADGFSENLSPIGLITDVAFNSDNSLKPMWEMGTDMTYFTRGKTAYNINIGAMVADKPSLMKLFTRQSPQQGGNSKDISAYPKAPDHVGQFWMNIDTEQTAVPFGILMIFKTKGGTEEGSNGEIVSAVYLENCNLGSLSFNISSQSVTIQENVSVMFDRMLAVDYTNPKDTAAVDNAATRITQGTDGYERLFTVRPRNVKSVTTKRGTPSSIKFNIPDKLKNNTSDYTSGLTDEGVITAFNEAIDTTGLGFINFIAQSVSYSIQEKSQIMHTFGGKEAVYFYGRAPVMVALSGTLVDDLDNDQFIKFMDLYMNFLRGSEAAKKYSYVTLTLNNSVFIGSFVNVSVQQTSDRDTDISFSAQFLAKSFTLVSSNSAFADGEGELSISTVHRDEDPSITRDQVQAIIEANARAITLTAEKDKENSSNATASLAKKNNGFFGDFASNFGSLPLPNEDAFSAEDISNFFGVITDTIGNLTAPATNLLSALSAWSKYAIGLMEAVEEGFDSIIMSVDSITRQYLKTLEDFDNLFFKLLSFPETISGKLGAIGSPGYASLPILGSDNISADTSASILQESSNIGALRGTPEGSEAKLLINSASNQTASLSTNTLSNSTGSSGITLGTSITIEAPPTLIFVGG